MDLDLFNNILRRPYGERFALVLNEFGTGLAGRGGDLKAAIHRANPALRETDRVLAILARQNRVLADLARDSDVALAPLAREKERCPASSWRPTTRPRPPPRAGTTSSAASSGYRASWTSCAP